MSDAAPPTPDQLVVRLRRLVTLWRTLFIAQATALLLLLVLGLLERLLPGVLPHLFRGHLPALPVLAGLAALVAALDVASAAVELAMGRTLRVPPSALRTVMTALSFVPGLLLLRRLVLLVLAACWLVLLFAVLLVYIVTVIVMAGPMWLSEAVTGGVGAATDLFDQALSELYALAGGALRAVSATPVYRVDKEEDAVLPLLRGQRRADAR